MDCSCRCVTSPVVAPRAHCVFCVLLASYPSAHAAGASREEDAAVPAMDVPGPGTADLPTDNGTSAVARCCHGPGGAAGVDMTSAFAE